MKSCILTLSLDGSASIITGNPRILLGNSLNFSLPLEMDLIYFLQYWIKKIPLENTYSEYFMWFFFST